MLYRFGLFEFESQTRLLFRAQERIPLTPKAADLLLVLLEHEGRLLGKDELLRLVWADTFVEEGSLSKHIFSLRKALGDHGQSAQFIETIPRRGYRFIGSLERTAKEDRVSAVLVEEVTRERFVIESQDATSTWYRRQQPVLALVCTLILIFGAVAWFVRSRGRAERPLRSLLVLPFANMGPLENEYFSDGLTHELIAAFSAVKGLRVIPRTTAFQFKARSGDLRAIGRQLDVEAVLDGGVQRDQGRLRIHLALTRVNDGYTVWSRSFDRQAQDVFATEDEVAAEVLRALFPNDRHSVDGRSLNGTKSVEAHNFYLKGNFIQQTQYNNEQALALYQRAAQLDPMYPEAWAGLAFCYLELGYGYQRYPKDVLPLAVQAVQRALQLNPRLALSHAIQGYLNAMFLRHWDVAKQEFETAISLDPNYGETHHWMSHFWVTQGRFKDAEDESRRALECDPLNFGISAHQIWLKYVQGRFPEAIRAAEDTLRLGPSHGPTNWYRMRAFEESGLFGEVIRTRRRLGWNDPPVDALEISLRQNGTAGYWRLFKESWLRRRNAGPARPFEIAWIYAHLGEREPALEWLARAVEEGDPWALYMKVEPPLASLRSDPRFIEIARSAGLP